MSHAHEAAAGAAPAQPAASWPLEACTHSSSTQLLPGRRTRHRRAARSRQRTCSCCSYGAARLPPRSTRTRHDVFGVGAEVDLACVARRVVALERLLAVLLEAVLGGVGHNLCSALCGRQSERVCERQRSLVGVRGPFRGQARATGARASRAAAERRAERSATLAHAWPCCVSAMRAQPSTALVKGGASDEHTPHYTRTACTTHTAHTSPHHGHTRVHCSPRASCRNR